MRCYLKRIIHVAFVAALPITLFIVYHLQYEPRRSSLLNLEIVYHRNQTYRLLSSDFVYHLAKPYLNFAFYHVEQRSRVLAIDSHYDVPISSQWDSKGHLYPIQIAQFGLSHWSQWKSPIKYRHDAIEYHEHLTIKENEFCSSWYSVKKNPIHLNETFIQFIISSNCSLYVHFRHADYTVVYSTESNIEPINSTSLIISLGHYSRSVNRNILVDIEKAKKKSLLLMKDELQLRICGQSNAHVSQLVIGDQKRYHEQAYNSAVRWLLENQDPSTGCWLSRTARSFGNHQQYRVPIPWCSAMAQGQAISLLVRRYIQTKNLDYLQAIRRAIQPLWSSNMTRAYFQNRFVWLEEYPLEKSAQGLFVLNGGLYALLGLLDAQSIDPHQVWSSLIDDLRLSLQELLPHYIDPNQFNGSLYDLGHLTLGLPVNVASFSYHLVHINLLQSLKSFFQASHPDTSTFLDDYIQRFRSFLMH